MSHRSAVRPQGGRIFVWAVVLCLLATLALARIGIDAKPAGLLGKLDAEYKVIDLSSGRYRVSPAVASGDDGSEPFSAMISRLKPYAAITGTYYDPSWKPLGDIVIDGKVVVRGGQRQGIGFTSKGQVKFLERKGASRIDWTGCVSGLACGPRLLRAGKKDIDVKRDGFSAAAATNTAWRCAVGASRDGKLILVTVKQPVTLSVVADVMLELGAVDAVNLDGGSMCAFYRDGKVVASPILPVSNVLAVYRTK